MHRMSSGNACREKYAASDHCASADYCFSAENCRARIHSDVIFKRGMALVAFAQRTIRLAIETLRAQRDALIDLAMLTDHCCLTDHHTGAVIDEKTAADLRARMDVDRCAYSPIMRGNSGTFARLSSCAMRCAESAKNPG